MDNPAEVKGYMARITGAKESRVATLVGPCLFTATARWKMIDDWGTHVAEAMDIDFIMNVPSAALARKARNLLDEGDFAFEVWSPLSTGLATRWFLPSLTPGFVSLVSKHLLFSATANKVDDYYLHMDEVDRAYSGGPYADTR